MVVNKNTNFYSHWFQKNIMCIRRVGNRIKMSAKKNSGRDKGESLNRNCRHISYANWNRGGTLCTFYKCAVHTQKTAVHKVQSKEHPCTEIQVWKPYANTPICLRDWGRHFIWFAVQCKWSDIIYNVFFIFISFIYFHTFDLII